MNKRIALSVGIVVVLIGAGAYWYSATHPQVVSAATVTIDKSSLYTSSTTPTIFGTAQGATEVRIQLESENIGAGSDGLVGNCTAQVSSENTWSCQIVTLGNASMLKPGKYAVSAVGVDASGHIAAPVKEVLTIPQSSELTGVTAPSSAPIITTSNGVTSYTNTQYGFSIRFPDNLRPATPEDNSWIYYGPTILYIKDINGSNTQGELRVEASTDPKVNESCTTAPDTSSRSESAYTSANNKSINGIPFLYYEKSDAGLGQFDTAHVYRVLKNATCFTLVGKISGVSTSHLESTEQASNEADIAATTSRVDAIIQSFKFSP